MEKEYNLGEHNSSPPSRKGSSCVYGDKIISVQTLMSESELLELKRVTGDQTTKGALRAAIDYYIERDGE